MGRPLPEDDINFALSLTDSFFSRFRGARILITGATGFLGRWLIEIVAEANVRHGAVLDVVALVRDPQKARDRLPHVFERAGVHLVGCDLGLALPNFGRADLCIHAAGPVGNAISGSSPHATFDAIFAATQRVAEAASSAGVSRFLFTSSGAVYGPQPLALDRIPETFRGAPDLADDGAAYANAKRAAEWWVGAAADASFCTSIARIFAVVGPGQRLDAPFAIANFIGDVLRGRPPTVKDGRPIRSYIYAADLSVWLLRILEAGRCREPYNVGSEVAISIDDLARVVSSAAAIPVPGDLARALSGASRYVPDTTRARTELGLREYTSLPSAVLKTISWNRSERQQ